MSNMCQQTEGNNKGLEAIFCLIYFPTCNQRPACLAVLVHILAPNKEHRDCHDVYVTWGDLPHPT